jgi:hypothetical protein
MYVRDENGNIMNKKNRKEENIKENFKPLKNTDNTSEHSSNNFMNTLHGIYMFFSAVIIIISVILLYYFIQGKKIPIINKTLKLE